MRRDSPPFGVFGDSLTSMIGRLRFAGGLGSRRLETGVDADVLAAYNDGSAGIVLCVVRRRRPGGDQRRPGGVEPAEDLGVRAACWRNWSSRCSIGTGRRRRPIAASRWWSTCRPRPARRPACEVRGPGDAGAEAAAGRYGELADEAVGAVWRWTSPGPPGVYRVERDGAPVFALAVNIPAEESQLDVLPPEVLTSRLAAGRAVVYHGAADEGQRRDDFWKWFAVACVVCVLGEISALLFFRT